MKFDKAAIAECDAMLAYLPKDMPMMGTPMEIMFAHILNQDDELDDKPSRPIVAFGDYQSPWIDAHVHTQVETLDEAVLAVKDRLGL